tara:strand:+ start:2598 stop:2804 length:207 start_codon:yes stop_codon:yes gene_type:complete
MPIKSANIDFSNNKLEEKTEKTESELRKEAISQILKDVRKFTSISGKIVFVSIFIYGLLSLLQDVNAI